MFLNKKGIDLGLLKNSIVHVKDVIINNTVNKYAFFFLI